MRAILMFQWEVMNKVTRQCPHRLKPPPFWRERRAEAVSNRGPSAYQSNALPLGQTGFRSYSKAGWKKDVVNQCLDLPGVWTHSNRLFLTPVSLKGDYCNPVCDEGRGSYAASPFTLSALCIRGGIWLFIDDLSSKWNDAAEVNTTGRGKIHTV